MFWKNCSKRTDTNTSSAHTDHHGCYCVDVTITRREKFCLWSAIVFLSCLAMTFSVSLVITIRRVQNLERHIYSDKENEQETILISNAAKTTVNEQSKSSRSASQFGSLDSIFTGRRRHGKAVRGTHTNRISRSISSMHGNQQNSSGKVNDTIWNAVLSMHSMKKTKTNHTTSPRVMKRVTVVRRSEQGIRSAPRDDRFKMYAAHFVSPDERTEFRYTTASCMQKWNGTFCRNSTYWSLHSNQRLDFLKPAGWMGTSMEQQSLEQISSGIFETQHSGMYLLYLNVMIQATAAKHDIGIYHGTRRLLNCREGLDIVRDRGGDRFYYSQARTCSVSGVFYLDIGQNLSVNIQNPLTTVVLHPDSTNFGALLFLDTWTENSRVDSPFIEAFG